MAAKLVDIQIVQTLKLRYLHFQSTVCSAYFFSKAQNNFLKTDIFLASENLLKMLMQENTYYSCFSVCYPVSLAFQCSHVKIVD